MDEHLTDMSIIQLGDVDIGIFKFYYNDKCEGCIAMFAVLHE